MLLEKFKKAIRKYREKGFWIFCQIYSKNAINKTKNLYYSLESTFRSEYITDAGGIKVDVASSVFSGQMIRIIKEENYEYEEKKLIKKHIESRIPVFDLGAGVGYTACIIDKNTDRYTPIIAVEANEMLIPIINRVKEINGCEFRVLHSAYGKGKKYVELKIANDFWLSSEFSGGKRNGKKVNVRCISIEGLIENFSIEGPVQVVVDIEGGEDVLIMEENKVLKNTVKTFIFEYHDFSDHNIRKYNQVLRNVGFREVDHERSVYAYKNTNL